MQCPPLQETLDEGLDVVKGVGGKMKGSLTDTPSITASVSSSRATSGASTPTTSSSFIADPLGHLTNYDFAKDFEQAMFAFGDDEEQED